MSAELRTSVRQKIFDAVKARFETIYQVNGFATNVGSHCFSWRDLERSPFTVEELSDGGAIVITDDDRAPDPSVLTVHDQLVTFTVIAASTPTGGFANADRHARRIEADLIVAIGQDRTWTTDGVRLAKDTILGESQINVGHFGEMVAAVRLKFTVHFRTARFDPYTQ